MKNITYSKINELTDVERFELERVVGRQFPKIERMIDGTCELKVNIKKITKEGKSKRFVISCILKTPTKSYNTKSKDQGDSEDYNITKAAHKEMEKLYSEVKHNLKVQGQSWKKYSLKSLFSKFKE